MNRKTNTAKLVDFDLIRMTGYDGKVTASDRKTVLTQHYPSLLSLRHNRHIRHIRHKNEISNRGVTVTLVKCHLVTGVTVVTGSFI
ncbi:MAG TPA: hypothetical protein DEV87_00305 [Clostridiales bacterium]|nr:hypothetical protein [Clostridiales bacterium]